MINVWRRRGCSLVALAVWEYFVVLDPEQLQYLSNLYLVYLLVVFTLYTILSWSQEYGENSYIFEVLVLWLKYCFHKAF